MMPPLHNRLPKSVMHPAPYSVEVLPPDAEGNGQVRVHPGGNVFNEGHISSYAEPIIAGFRASRSLAKN